jgi:hypothetical protein
MILRSTRYLTSAERAANQTKNPFHVLLRSDTWRERKEGFVEILEFHVDKAWLVPGCDRGPGCCPGSLLLRTPKRQFICLWGSVRTSPVYHFSWASSYKAGRCDGDHVVIERWPKTKGIYSVRFSGAPVEHVSLDEWEAGWGRLTGPCDIVCNERLDNLPEH